jgi:hypothetical protein
MDVLDLRSVTRDSDKTECRILLQDHPRHPASPWIILGQVLIRLDRHLPLLMARAKAGVTDFEHDSAYVLRIPLIGVKLLEVDHEVELEAYIHPGKEGRDDFLVPVDGYDPEKLEGATICEECEEKHVIVPEGYYAGPPFNQDLHEELRGRRIIIRIGPPHA